MPGSTSNPKNKHAELEGLVADVFREARSKVHEQPDIERNPDVIAEHAAGLSREAISQGRRDDPRQSPSGHSRHDSPKEG